LDGWMCGVVQREWSGVVARIDTNEEKRGAGLYKECGAARRVRATQGVVMYTGCREGVV